MERWRSRSRHQGNPSRWRGNESLGSRCERQQKIPEREWSWQRSENQYSYQSRAPTLVWNYDRTRSRSPVIQGGPRPSANRYGRQTERQGARHRVRDYPFRRSGNRSIRQLVDDYRNPGESPAKRSYQAQDNLVENQRKSDDLIPVVEDEVDFSVDPDDLVYLGEEEEELSGSLGSPTAQAEVNPEVQPLDVPRVVGLGSPTVQAVVNPEVKPQEVSQRVCLGLPACNTGGHLELSDEGSREVSGDGQGANVQQRDKLAMIRSCPICNRTARKIYRHILAEHLPWFFSPETACWNCQVAFGTLSKPAHHRKRNGCGDREWPLGQWLLSMKRLLEELAGMLNCRQEQIHFKAECVSTPVAPLREALLTFLEEAQGRTVSHIDLAPPSCPSAICTVTVMTTLLCQLSPSQQFTIHHLSLVQDSYVLAPLNLVDAHCHLRQLKKKEPKWLTRGRDKVSPAVNGMVTVVDNAVFSGDWNHVPPSSGDGYRVLQTVGVHPRLATDPTAWSQVKHLIEKPECVGIGECGLDATALSTKDPKNTMMQQEELVQKHAELAIATGKPLVLHIRGKGQKSNQALYRRMLTLLQEAGLGKQHRVYVHCFTGSLEDVLSWRSAFPRVLFGISRASTRTTDFESVGRLIPLDHLALESDAPHLSPRKGEVNRPQWIWHQAVKLARLRNLPTEVIIRRCNLNSAAFYVGY